MPTVGKSAAVSLAGAAGESAARIVAGIAGVNAAFTGGDTLAVDMLETLAVDGGADSLAVDLDFGIAFIGKSAAEGV